MKPLLLKLVAFGPYVKAQKVDFRLLGSHPMFLINGPTGAGKSAILDAICFALYGGTTGAERDATQMRCDFAPPELLTEVTLEFALADKQYRIRRIPQQERPKSRGEGTTTQQSEAQFWELDGSEEGKLLVARKVNDATDLVRGLIGLDIDQFRQVMVLPQGQFRKFLLADSRERETIFSQLFQTHIYKQIEESLKNKASGIKQEVESHQNLIRLFLESAEVNSEQEITDTLVSVAPELDAALAAKETADAARQAVEQQKEQAIQLSARFKELKEKRAQLTATKAREQDIKRHRLALSNSLTARTIQPSYQHAEREAATLERLQQELSVSATELNLATAKLELAIDTQATATAKAKELDRLTKEQIELEQLVAKSQQLTSAQAELQETNQAVTANQGLLAKTQSQLDDLTKEQKNCIDTMKTLGEELQQLAPQQIALNESKAQVEQREQLQALQLQELEDVKNELNAQQRREEVEQVLASHTETATKLEIAWHAGQAALLARGLEGNEPCPVCGSKNHPKPAASTNVIEKTAVDDARQLEDQSRSLLEDAKENWSSANNQVVSIRKDIQRVMEQLGPLAKLTLEEVRATHQSKKATVEQLLIKQKEHQQFEARVKSIEASQVALKTDVDVATDELKRARESQIKASTLVDQLMSAIPEALREPEALHKEAEQVGQRIDQIKTVLAYAEKELIKAREANTRATSEHKSLEKQIEDQSAETRDATSALATAINKSPFTTEQEFQNALLDDAEREALQDTIQQWQTGLDTQSGAVVLLEKSIGEQGEPDIEAIEEMRGEKVARFKQADENWRTLETKTKQLKEIQNKLEHARKKNAALDAEYKIIGTLSEVANGQTGIKISLQRFVLSVLLDDVLIQASQRLLHMSKGRYELIRKGDRAKGNKASGLELEVKDGYSGTTRSVATLSGGESFMAALSLALGLSDVVQAYAGGIKLDTLFIDEGFGSLDQESLDLAITTLIDLQTTGRMIGIISHVTELKEQMNLRLDVESDREGSRITTVGAW